MECKLANTRALINELVGKVSRFPAFSFDTESSAPRLFDFTKKKPKDFINVYVSTTTGCSFAFSDGTAYYVPIFHQKGDNCPPDLLEMLKRALRDTKAEIWAWNWCHDFKAGDRMGVDFRVLNYQDAFLLPWLLNEKAPGKSPFGLKAQALMRLGFKMAGFEDTAKGRMFSELSVQEAMQYACDDAIAVEGMRESLVSKCRDKDLLDAYYNVELPCVPVTSYMEDCGVGLDAERLLELHGTLDSRIVALEDEWDFLFPGVSIRSTKQIHEALYEGGIWRPFGKLSKKGEYPSNKLAIEFHANSNPPGSIAHTAAVLKQEYQFLHKNASTYTTSLVSIAQQYPDRRLHPSFMQTGTGTGRYSSSYPNGQNIPIRTDLGKSIQDCFVAAEGHSIISTDYSQIELRLLAHLAGGGTLFDALRAGSDPHQATADATGLTRDASKTLNFAVVYGAGPKKLGIQLGCSTEEARDFLKQWEGGNGTIVDLKKRVLRAAYARGYVKTLAGRGKDLPAMRLREYPAPRYEDRDVLMDRWSDERKAFNAPIQGGAADVVKMGMVKYYQRLRKEGLLGKVKIVAQIHDDVKSEAPTEMAQYVAEMQQQCLETACELRVPLVAEPAIGRTWMEAK